MRPAEGEIGRASSMPNSLRWGTDALAEDVAERTAGEARQLAHSSKGLRP